MSANGFANLIILLFLIALIGGFIYLIYRIVLFAQKKLAADFKQIGDKYGLALAPGKLKYYKQNKNAVLIGTIKGHDFVCNTYCVGRNERTKVEWTEFTFQHGLNVQGYELRLTGENIFKKMGKGLAAVQEIEIGVQDFDKRFLIHSENVSTTRSILNQAIRTQLLTIPVHGYFGALLIDGTELCYKIPHQLNHDINTRKHFETALAASVLIMDELERVYK